MELQEAVLAYRAQIAELFGKVDPRPTDEWIAKRVDELLPLEMAETLSVAPQFMEQEASAA
ncbi:MAG TPA: hypothetical protein VGC78_13430 [Gaiellaceae bacterium]|jgi:hypothetical protein